MNRGMKTTRFEGWLTWVVWRGVAKLVSVNGKTDTDLSAENWWVQVSGDQLEFDLQVIGIWVAPPDGLEDGSWVEAS